MHPNTENAHNASGAHGGGYEHTDVEVGIPARFLVGLVILLLAGIFLMRVLFGFLSAEHKRTDAPPSPLASELPAEPPLPRLQKTPVQDLNKLREEEKNALESYGWVEQNAGVARIPIERAVDLVLERGLPVRGEAAKARGKK